MSHKRRVSHNIIQPVLRYNILPVQPQGVPLGNVGIGPQGKKIQGPVDDVLRLLHHLALGDPQGSPGYRHSEIIDFNTVKLSDGHLDKFPSRHQGLSMIK